MTTDKVLIMRQWIVLLLFGVISLIVGNGFLDFLKILSHEQALLK